MFFLSPLTPISVLVYDYFLYFALNTGEFFRVVSKRIRYQEKFIFYSFHGIIVISSNRY